MFISRDYGFADLKDACWSGAIQTLELVEEQDAEDELMSLLKEVFEDETPTLTQVNDYLRFEAEEDLLDRGILSAIDEEDDEDEE